MTDQKIIVAKFGGTSLADAQRIRHVVKIIHADPARRCIVVSAPGKRFKGDTKVTDLLKQWVECPDKREHIFSTIRERFTEIVRELGLSLDINALLGQILAKAKYRDQKRLLHFMMSRGEWLSAQIVAAACDFEFVDAADVIHFTSGRFDMELTMKMEGLFNRTARAQRGIVIPGFYGTSYSSRLRMTGGRICTFSRGGSDITGSIMAVIIGASVYENWTDVDGVLSADPRIVKNPRLIREMSYVELRELSYRGADVFHTDAAWWVWDNNIPTHIRNTAHPESEGTWIRPTSGAAAGVVTGIAARNGFTVLTIRKYDMQFGYLHKLTGVFYRLRIDIAHVLDSVDTVSFVISSEDFRAKRERIEQELERSCEPDRIDVEEDVMIVCTVGLRMKHAHGVAGRLTTAVGKVGASMSIIDQSAAENNITIGVKEVDGVRVINAIHDEFVPQ